MVVILFSASSCLGQKKGEIDQTVAVPVVQNILSGAQASGSLEYWGICDLSKPRPVFPKLRAVSDREGSALKVLQEVFADYTTMRVTQDSDGKIRMVEADVQKDFLDIRIHHLSFPANYYGSRMALYAILHTPEVEQFRTEHQIAPTGFGVPSDVGFILKPSVVGTLKDVTVAQALDYVLQTFPGFWTYQNCYDADGERTVFINFHDDLNPAGAAPVPKTK